MLVYFNEIKKGNSRSGSPNAMWHPSNSTTHAGAVMLTISRRQLRALENGTNLHSVIDYGDLCCGEEEKDEQSDGLDIVCETAYFRLDVQVGRTIYELHYSLELRNYGMGLCCEGSDLINISKKASASG